MGIALCLVHMLCYVVTFVYANVEYSSIKSVYIVELQIKHSSLEDDKVFTTLNRNIPNLTYAKPLSTFLKSADPSTPEQCQSTLVCDTKVSYENRYMSSTYDPYTIPCFAWANKPCSSMRLFAKVHMCAGVNDCLSCCVDDTETSSGLSQHTATILSFSFVLCGVVICMCALFIYCFKIKDFVPAKFKIARTDPMATNKIKFKFSPKELFSSDIFGAPATSMPVISFTDKLYPNVVAGYDNVQAINIRNATVDHHKNSGKLNGKQLLENIKVKSYSIYQYVNKAVLSLDDKINKYIKRSIENNTNLHVSNGIDIEKSQKNEKINFYSQSHRTLPKSRNHIKEQTVIYDENLDISVSSVTYDRFPGDCCDLYLFLCIRCFR